LPVLRLAGARTEHAQETAFDNVARLAHEHAGHPQTERVRERDEHDGVDDELCERLPAHLEVLASEERVHQVREHGERDREADCVGRRHQTRPSTYRSRNANAKQAAAIASAAKSYMTPTVRPDD